MWNQTQINRVAHAALQKGDHLAWLAALVAQNNFNTYGILSPENVAAIQKSWGEA